MEVSDHYSLGGFYFKRVLAPAGEYLSFACPKERYERKGHPRHWPHGVRLPSFLEKMRTRCKLGRVASSNNSSCGPIFSAGLGGVEGEVIHQPGTAYLGVLFPLGDAEALSVKWMRQDVV